MSKKRNKGGKFTPEDENMTPEEKVEAAEAAEADAAPEAAFKATPPPAEPEIPVATLGARVKASPSEKGMAVVRPVRDLKRVRIGTRWFSFQKGKTVKVPKEIVPHLREKGIV